MKLLIPVSAVAICLLALASGVSSHEPITTSVTFNKEVVRIFQRSCFGCHSSGSLTGIPLTTYEEARPWAKAIKEEILEKRMPPFQAVIGYGSFHNGYRLTQREIELIVSWVEGGAPRGEAKDLPNNSVEGQWPLGQPDLILQPENETRIEAGEGRETRCFMLPVRQAQSRWLSAIDFRPGNTATVDSAEFTLEKAGTEKCGSAAGEKLGQWAPGQTTVKLPAGIGRLLPANARIALKVRYRKSGEAATDRSAIGLYFAKEENVNAVRDVRIAAPVTAVPAGAESQRVKATWQVREQTEAVAVRPLPFPLGKSVEVTAWRPDGTAEVLIVVKGYRYDWQPVYYFKNPVTLPAGTRLEVTAYLDNSDHNRNLAEQKIKLQRFSGPLCEIMLAQSSRKEIAGAKSPVLISSSAARKH
ncbi:MAG: cytochrome c [Blastocatellia bacterium]